MQVLVRGGNSIVMGKNGGERKASRECTSEGTEHDAVLLGRSD